MAAFRLRTVKISTAISYLINLPCQHRCGLLCYWIRTFSCMRYQRWRPLRGIGRDFRRKNAPAILSLDDPAFVIRRQRGGANWVRIASSFGRLHPPWRIGGS